LLVYVILKSLTEKSIRYGKIHRSFVELIGLHSIFWSQIHKLWKIPLVTYGIH